MASDISVFYKLVPQLKRDGYIININDAINVKENILFKIRLGFELTYCAGYFFYNKRYEPFYD